MTTSPPNVSWSRRRWSSVSPLSAWAIASIPPCTEHRTRRLTSATYNRMVVSMTTTYEPDLVFAALADATRRDIVLRALTGQEGVAELAGHYPMSFAAVQKHVAVLERAGLVTKQRHGRRKVVRTDIERVRLARSLLDRYELLWRGRIERMQDLIASTEETP